MAAGDSVPTSTLRRHVRRVERHGLGRRGQGHQEEGGACGSLKLHFVAGVAGLQACVAELVVWM